MATINYPASLPKATASGYGSQETTAFIESNPAAGGFYTFKQTDDIWAVYTLQFVLTEGQAIYLKSWFRSQLANGSLPFNMSMLIDGEEIEKECKFTRGGIPQLTGQQGKVYTYSAEVFVRDNSNSYTNEFETLDWFAERAPDGNPFTGMALLDKAITETAPEV